MRLSPAMAGMNLIARQVKNEVKKKWIQVIRIKHLAESFACKPACKTICKAYAKPHARAVEEGLPRPFAQPGVNATNRDHAESRQRLSGEEARGRAGVARCCGVRWRRKNLAITCRSDGLHTGRLRPLQIPWRAVLGNA